MFTTMGNIGKDATLRKVNVNGVETSVCSFWIAENIKKRDNTVRTLWHKVTIWRGYAEAMVQYLKSGRHVYVTGTVEAKTYTSKDNRIVPYIDIQASEIKLLDSKKDDDVPPETEVSEENAEEETPWD